jgi:hypothetical protein
MDREEEVLISLLSLCILFSRFRELNPSRRVYAEIPKPSRVELKCNQNPRRYEALAEGFDVILVTPEIDPTSRF